MNLLTEITCVRSIASLEELDMKRNFKEIYSIQISHLEWNKIYPSQCLASKLLAVFLK